MVDMLFKVIGLGGQSGSNRDVVGGFEGQEGESGGFFAGIKNIFRLLKEAFKGWVKKQIGADLNNVFDAQHYEKYAGIKDKGNTDKEQAQSEEQTKRMKASTAKGQNRVVEPSIFYTNTIDLDYDFFEFGNRSVVNPFMMRSEHSKLLHDNLVNNNNKNPIQQFNIRCSALKQTITEGE